MRAFAGSIPGVGVTPFGIAFAALPGGRTEFPGGIPLTECPGGRSLGSTFIKTFELILPLETLAAVFVSDAEPHPEIISVENANAPKTYFFIIYYSTYSRANFKIAVPA